MNGGLLDRCPVVPVLVLDDARLAAPLGRALLDGGIDVVEVTLRTGAALDVIARLTDLPGLLVGAGTVLDRAAVTAVAAAGARFVVSPGLSPDVLRAGADLGLAALPGVATATELMHAVALGVRDVKFFPAAALGGPATIAALSAPFAGVRFLPSGGVTPGTMADYLKLPCVPAVSGSWMVAADLLATRDWAEVTRRSAEAVRLARALAA